MPPSSAAFAACLPGLEPLLATELRELGADPQPAPGGAHFTADLELLQRCGLWLGTASHVLLRLADFRCRALGELERKTATMPWQQWLRRDVAAQVTATARRSRLFHTGAITERVERSIHNVLGDLPALAPDSDAPVARIAVRFEDDHCTISLDTSVTPLHRRGYRLASGKAPLREDIAHALVLAAQVPSGAAVLDPFCGSGTIAIEAAALLHGLPPGRLRPPPLQHLAMFDAATWARVAAARPEVNDPPRVAAGDRDAGVIESARANAERAGLADAIEFTCAALRAQPWLRDPATAPAIGRIVTNPPYGLRVSAGRSLLPLYQTFGNCVSALGAGWSATLLAHDPRLARRSGLPLQAVFTTRHGGVAVTALRVTAQEVRGAATSPDPDQPTR